MALFPNSNQVWPINTFTFFSVVSTFYTFEKLSFEEKGLFVLPRISLNQLKWSHLILTQGMTVKSAVKVYSFSLTIG